MKCELTNLKTRKALINTVAKRNDLIVFIINVDNFRETNLKFGNDVADNILIYIAKQLTSFFDSLNYELYRLYSSNFAIISHSFDYSSKLRKVQDFMSKIEKDDHKINDFKYSINLTAGAALGDNAFNYAENALLEAKSTEKNIVLFTKNTTCEVDFVDIHEEILRLKKAIEEDRLVPFFQPIFNIKSGKIEKFETLARIFDRDKIISPFYFLNAAKKAKLYSTVTKTIIEKACLLMSINVYEFSINLDASDLTNEETIEFLIKTAIENDVADRLIVEILETHEIEESQIVMKNLQRLREIGVKVAIDDFGTGYSNFEIIQKLSPDFLKIDGSLVKNIKHEREFKTLKAIAAFAKTLHIKTVAEFVENGEILEKLVGAGVDFAQGYFISEPTPFLYTETANLSYMKKNMKKEGK